MAFGGRSNNNFLESFFGRESEVRRAELAIESCTAGSGRLLTFEGEPGIGKTRLARHISEIAIKRGFMVLSGSFSLAHSEVAFSGWVEVLNQLIHAIPPDLHPVEHDRRFLEQLIPGLSQSSNSTGNYDGDKSLEFDISRLLMFQAVTRLVSNSSAWKPLLIRLEDLHWADRSSIALLKHLGHSLNSMPVVVMATIRDTHQGSQDLAIELTSELSGDEGLERLQLKGLSEEPARQLISVASEGRLMRPVAEEIVMRSGRNPLYLIELARWWPRSDEPNTRSTVPTSIVDFMKGRLKDLSEAALQILQTTSIQGRSADLELVARLHPKLRNDQIDDLISECVNAGLIDLIGHPVKAEFRHDLTRQAIYESIPPLIRADYHLRTANVIEAGFTRPQAEIAYHLDLSLDSNSRLNAIELYKNAGHEAFRVRGWETAQNLFHRALSIAMDLDRVAAQPELLEWLGRSLLPLDPEKAYPQLVEAFDRYEAEGDLDKALEVSLINARPLIGKDTGERVLRERGLRLAVDGSTESGILHARIGLSAALSEADFDRAKSHISQADAIAKRHDDDRVLLFAGAAKINLLYVEIRLREAYEELPNVLGLARDQQDLLTEGSLLLFHAELAMYLGDPDLAQVAAERLETIGERIGEPRMIAEGQARLVIINLMFGRFETALGLNSEHLDRFSLARHQALAQTSVENNDPDGWGSALRNAISAFHSPDTHVNSKAIGAFQLSVLGAMANTTRWSEEVRSLVAGIEPRTGQLPSYYLWASGARMVLACVEGASHRVSEHLTVLEPVAKLITPWGPVTRFLAAAKLAIGDSDGMRANYEDALEVSRKLAIRPIFAWICFEYAMALTEQHSASDRDKERVEQLLADSSRVARSLRLRLLESRIRSLRNRVGRGSSVRLESLTPRELQVLEMVADGHTNKEISFTLGASLNTIYRHTSSIYTKLGVTNRTEAALTYRQVNETAKFDS